jgi:hypothetical protein
MTHCRILGLDENASLLDAHGVDRGAEGRLVEAHPGLDVELPAVPRAAENAAAGEPVAARLALHSLVESSQAERPPVVRAAVSETVQGAVGPRDDAHVAPADPGGQPPVALEVGSGADVHPLSQRREARAGRRRARLRSRGAPSPARPPGVG